MEIIVNLFSILVVFIKVQDVLCIRRSRGTADFCLFDTFEAKCNQNEVVIIDSALYGRMKVSRCAEKDSGKMGCFANVKNIMGGLCTGKQTCDVAVVNPRLIATRPCPGQAAPYLTISYSCLEVISDTNNDCTRKGTVPVLKDSGHIPSIPMETKPTSNPCKWKLTSLSQKQLNITLHKFSKPDINKGSPPVCYEALSIKEGTNTKTILTCPSDPDVKPVYLSQGSSIEITFPKHSTSINGASIIQFDSVGCGQPKIPEDSHFTRRGHQVTVTCNKTRESWELSCTEDEWHGEERQCSAGWMLSSVMGTDSSYQYGVLLIVVTGIALGVLIGGFLLYLAINAFKRYHGLLPAQQIQNPSYEKTFYDPNNKLAYNDRTIQRSSMIYGTNRRSYPNRQMLPPVPPPHADSAQMRPPSEISENNRQSHIYETPLFNSL